MRKGPVAQGRLWTPADDSHLLTLLAFNLDKVLIARKLKRTVSAVTKRKSLLKTRAGGAELESKNANE
jgi:hypothetical protein